MDAVLFGGTAVHCLISVKQTRRGTSGDVLSRELLADDRTGDFEAEEQRNQRNPQGSWIATEAWQTI